MSIFQKYEKPIWVFLGVLLSVCMVITVTFFTNLADLGEYFSKNDLFSSLAIFFYLTPTWSSLMAIPTIMFVYMTRRRFERRQWWIIAVAAILSLCTVLSQPLVTTHTLHSLFDTPLNVFFSIVSFLTLTAFAFALLRPAFYRMEKFSQRWIWTGIDGAEDIDKEPKSQEAAVDEASQAQIEMVDKEETSENYADAQDDGVEKPQTYKLPTIPTPAFRARPWHYVVAYIALIVCWLPYIIGFSPGYIHNDTVYQLFQFAGYLPFSEASPLLATLIYGGLFQLGLAIGGPNVGLFVITIMQNIVCAAVVIFELYVLHKMRAPRWFILLVFAFFALNPIFGSIASLGMQDCLHGALFAVYITLFVMYLRDPKTYAHSIKWMIFLIAAAVLTSLTRHNAYYAIIVSLPLLCLFQQGARERLKALVPLVIGLLLVPLINTGLIAALDVQSRLSVNSTLSAPVQQVARYALEHPDDVTPEEYEALNRYFDYDNLGEAYQWNLADTATNLRREDADVNDFWPAWWAQGWRHPLTYADAFGELTYGYWSVQTRTEYPRETFGTGQTHLDVNGENIYNYGFWMPYWGRKAIDHMQEWILSMPFMSFTTQGGFYLWIAFIGMAYLGFCRRKRYALIFLPIVMIMLTLIAGPKNNSLRYFFDCIFATPMLIWAAVYFSRIPIKKLRDRKVLHVDSTHDAPETDTPTTEGLNAERPNLGTLSASDITSLPVEREEKVKDALC